MPRSVEVDDGAGSVASFATYSEASSWGSADHARKHKKYPFVKKFAYQKFVGWRPILTPRNAELFFVAAGVLLLALGIPILIASLNVVEVRVPYAFEGPFADKDSDSRQALLWGKSDDGVKYLVTVTIPDRMEPPIYVVYELGSYFQNFRRYVRSYDPARMHDGASSGSPVSACNPFSYLDPSDNGSQALPINPCGQIAQSFFNDSFAFSATAPPPAGAGAAGPATPLAVDSSSIAWSSDADHLYGDVPAENYNPGGAAAPLRGGNTSELPLNKNQHWMVWMRPHSQVALQKPWGVINTPLEAGSVLTVEVTNRYNTYGFDGAKTVIVTTNSWVGGKNNFLGACYIAVGGLCLLAALFFFVGYDLNAIWKRPYGDMANLSWLRAQAVELKQQERLMQASSGSLVGRSSPPRIPEDGAADRGGGSPTGKPRDSHQPKNL